MYRDIDEQQIRPEALMTSRDMVKLNCDGCRGCSECCRDRGSAILLDTIDIREMKNGLSCSFRDLLAKGYITLMIADGVILPALAVKDDACIFLSNEGRCSIHTFRPGICRMFPLARLWHDDGSFSYFLQEGECPSRHLAKTKISKWLGIQNLPAYEEELKAYHAELVKLREKSSSMNDQEELAKMQMDFLEKYFE